MSGPVILTIPFDSSFLDGYLFGMATSMLLFLVTAAVMGVTMMWRPRG